MMALRGEEVVEEISSAKGRLLGDGGCVRVPSGLLSRLRPRRSDVEDDVDVDAAGVLRLA